MCLKYQGRNTVGNVSVYLLSFRSISSLVYAHTLKKRLQSCGSHECSHSISNGRIYNNSFNLIEYIIVTEYKINIYLENYV